MTLDLFDDVGITWLPEDADRLKSECGDFSSGSSAQMAKKLSPQMAGSVI
jgi:hypothetical protein